MYFLCSVSDQPAVETSGFARRDAGLPSDRGYEVRVRRESAGRRDLRHRLGGRGEQSLRLLHTYRGQVAVKGHPRLALYQLVHIKLVVSVSRSSHV